MITSNTLRLFVIANLVFASMLLSYAQAQTTVTVPDPPTGLSGMATTPTSSKLSWTAPANNGGTTITGYKIEVKKVPGDYTVLVANNVKTAYNHTGLTTGNTYIYRVSAINSAGSSIPSNEVVVKPTKSSSGTNPPPTTTTSTNTQSPTSSNSAVPGTPAGLVSTMTSATSILLSWSTPSNTGIAITGYKIEFKTDTDQWSVLVANTGAVNSYSVTGLTTGTTYTYRVSAINSAGSSNPSNAISITTKSTTTPTGLVATAISPTSIFLSWVASSENFGQTITGYKIERNLGGSNYDTVVSSTASASTTFTVTGLTTGKSYTFVVSAVYGATSSGQSNPATATPTSTSKAPANLSSGNSATLSSGTPSVKMPSKNPLNASQKNTNTATTTVPNTETSMEKAAGEANAKAIADAKAAFHKRLAAAKNGTSIAPGANSTEKLKAAQKLKDIQAENNKLNQRLKSQLK